MFDPNIFRDPAIRHYLNRERESIPVPLRIAPSWTWWILWLIGLAAFLAVLMSTLFKVDMRGSGRGVIRVAGGARPLAVQISGRVARVAGAPGQKVRPGDLILELEAARIQTELFEAEHALGQFEQTTRPGRTALDRLAEIQVREAINRQKILNDQLASQEASVHLFERKLAAIEELSRYGLVSLMSIDSAKEDLAQTKRSVNSAQQSVIAAKQEVASLQARRDADILQYRQEYQRLKTRRDSLVFSLEQTRVTAPETGIVEGIHLRPGDIVNAGQTIGRLLTSEGSQKGYALLSQRDRPHIKVGDKVRLEVDQYPVADWGTLKATVTRIGENPSSITELREIFGEDARNDGGASYLVELSLTDEQTHPVARQPLQSGMGFQALYTLQRKRPIAFLLEPLRQWFE